MTSTCLTGIAAYDNATTTYSFLVGGFTGSVHTCLDFAVDGWTLWGVPMLYRIGQDADNSVFGDATGTDNVEFSEYATELSVMRPWATAANGDDIAASGVAGTTKAINSGQLRTMVTIHNTAQRWHCMLFTASEYFVDTPFHCIKADASASGNSSIVIANISNPLAANVLAKATFGSTWGMWPFDKDNTTTANYLSAQVPDQIMFVGTIQGKGMISRQDFAGATALPTLETTLTASTTGVATTSSNVIKVDAPANGMAQFKGLTVSTTEADYVQVICIGVAPQYATWAIDMNSTSSPTTRGFVVNCYTGIPQCASKLTDSVTYLNTTSATTVVSTCMADPRYLTWRSFVLKIQYDGTVNWYRVDSYYNSAAKAAASTWGPGIILSTNGMSNDDNIGTTSALKGRTFVFAYSDGSGI